MAGNPRYGDAPPSYSAYPPSGYEGRPPPGAPAGAHPNPGYAPPPGGPPQGANPSAGYAPPPGGPPQGAAGDERGLGGMLVGLGAASMVGNAIQQGNQQHPPPQPGAYAGPPMEGTAGLGRSNSREDPLAILRRFDTVIIIDDSASMSQENRWGEAEQALRGVAEKIVLYDADGVDVYFLNSSNYLQNARSAQQISEVFARVRPNGASTPTEVRVEELLSMYLDRLEQGKAQGQPALKPLNLLIITDGAADDPDTLAYAISGFCERLDAGHFPLTQLGIQFVQVGSDPAAARALRELDDDLKSKTGARRDIVDTTPYQGRITGDFIIKVLLGGINRRVDRG